MVTHKDSGLTYEDVISCGKKIDFGIGDPNSTSGFLVPSTFVFAQNGINPRDCFKTVRNANHETNLISVATKRVDAAVASSGGLYHRLKKAKPELFAEIKEIWRSPLIASDPMAWRPELDKSIKAKIMHFFMTYGRLGTDEEVRSAREKRPMGRTWAAFGLVLPVSRPPRPQADPPGPPPSPHPPTYLH